MRGRKLCHKCDVCTPGKLFQTRNREPDSRAEAPLEMVHTDLAVQPIMCVSVVT